MSTDPLIQSLEDGQAAELPGGSQKQNGNGKTDVKKEKSSDLDGVSNDNSKLQVDGLAVSMDGREIEVTRLPGTIDEQDADAQDLDSRRQTQLRKQNRFTKASVLIPPENFGIVEDGLYRSGQPTELNFPFLERLGLRSLIWLAPEEPHQRFLDFLREHNIQLHHLGVLQATNAWDPITEEVVLKALDIILQPSSYPLVVMCNLGRHRTGTVIGCLRKLQRWNLASIFEEYRRHAGAKVRVLNEQFIELFDTDLVHIPIPTCANGDTSTASSDRS